MKRKLNRTRASGKQHPLVCSYITDLVPDEDGWLDLTDEPWVHTLLFGQLSWFLDSNEIRELGLR
jgi:hypothetical protein